VRHNLRMPKQHSPEGTAHSASPGLSEEQDMPAEKATAPEHWRCPVALRVKSVVTAAAGAATTLVFFPSWFGVPLAVVLAAWGLGMAVLGASIAVDRTAGTLALRMGLIVRRVRLTDVTAVLVDQAKLSVGRAHGGEISVYAWRKSPLDSLLGVPAVASDIGHGIASAVALAKAAQDSGAVTDGAQSGRPGRTPARTRSRLATALLGGAGALAIAGALLVRVHWHNPVLTVLSVILALALGICGLLYLLVALWILLTGHAPRTISL
jgi:uncharacterized membrane protein YdbT with pleckstrin-like domain